MKGKQYSKGKEKDFYSKTKDGAWGLILSRSSSGRKEKRPPEKRESLQEGRAIEGFLQRSGYLGERPVGGEVNFGNLSVLRLQRINPHSMGRGEYPT